MTQYINEEDDFYRYAIEIFKKAGHITTSIPEFKNHSPEQFIYLDNNIDIPLTDYQRSLFQFFNNISHLFTFKNCTFFSIDLFTTERNRSQIARDVHEIINSVVDSKGTVCIFHFNDEVMLSFMGFGYGCFLSDWYPIFNDDNLVKKLDIANMVLNSDLDYFTDMIYSLSRSYYIKTVPLIYEIIPTFFYRNLEFPELEKYEIEKLRQSILNEPLKEYGSDYVEYQDIKEDFNDGLEQLIMEMEFNELDISESKISKTEINNKPEEKIESKNEYEFNDVDQRIFEDPTLLLKLIKDSKSKE